VETPQDDQCPGRDLNVDLLSTVRKHYRFLLVFGQDCFVLKGCFSQSATNSFAVNLFLTL
jgi:hypothetical protein